MDTYEVTIAVPSGKTEFSNRFGEVEKRFTRNVLIDRNSAKQAARAIKGARVLGVRKFREHEAVIDRPIIQLQKELPLVPPPPIHAAMALEFPWLKRQQRRATMYKDRQDD